MTPAQKQAIEDARKILKAHFSSWLLTYRITDENLNSKINHDWHGDITDITGLAAITQHRILMLTSMKPQGGA